MGLSDECGRSTFDPYGQHTPNPRSQCAVHITASVDSSYCLRILGRLDQEKNKLGEMQLQQGAACADPKSRQCSDATVLTNKSEREVQHLWEQYQFCRAAASNLGSLPTRNPNAVPVPKKQTADVQGSTGTVD